MKKNVLFFVLLALTLGFFNSCTDDEDATPPTLNVSEVAGATYTVGSIVTFEIQMSSNVDLEYFEISPTMVGGTGTGVIAMSPLEAIIDDELGGFDFGNGLTNVTVTYAFAIPTTLGNGTVVDIEFFLEDADADNSVTKSFTVVSGAGNVDRFTAVLMGSQANATIGSFYSTSTNEVFSMSEIAANKDIIDLVYYLGANDHVTIAAPSDANAITIFNTLDGTFNATVFDLSVDFTVADFTAATDDAIFSGVSGSDTRATDLSENALIGFETANGKKGAFLVTGIAGTTYGETSTITVEVLVQE